MDSVQARTEVFVHIQQVNLWVDGDVVRLVEVAELMLLAQQRRQWERLLKAFHELLHSVGATLESGSYAGRA
jgi:hypothetical protein